MIVPGSGPVDADIPWGLAHSSTAAGSPTPGHSSTGPVIGDESETAGIAPRGEHLGEEPGLEVVARQD